MIAAQPVQDIFAGREALARDLARYLGDRNLVDVGWEQPNDLTLLVPMFGVRPTGECDLYLLKLEFDCYPDCPPRTQFVNPVTRTFAGQSDIAWMPSANNVPHLGFHVNYNGQGQLICSSMTAEFYFVNHDVAAEHVWQKGKHTFASTLAAIRRGLVAPHYIGRQSG